MSYPVPQYRGGAASPRTPTARPGTRRPRGVPVRRLPRVRPPLPLRPPAIPLPVAAVARMPGFAGVALRVVGRLFWPVSAALLIADVLPYLLPRVRPIPRIQPGDWRRVKGPHAYPGTVFVGGLRLSPSIYTGGDGRIDMQSLSQHYDPSLTVPGPPTPGYWTSYGLWWSSIAPVGTVGNDRFAQHTAWQRVGFTTLPAAPAWPVWASPAPMPDVWPGLEPWAPAAFPDAFPPGLANPVHPMPPAIAREVAKARPGDPTAPVRHSPPSSFPRPTITPAFPPAVQPEVEAPSVVEPIVFTPPRSGGGKRPGPAPEGHKRRPRRSRRREREAKLKGKLAVVVGIAGNVRGGFSEFNDLMDSLYKAIPARLRTQSFHDGQRVRPSWKKRWNDVYQNWESIDWNQAAKNWLANEIDDQIIGRSDAGVPRLAKVTGTSTDGPSRLDSGWLPDDYQRGSRPGEKDWSPGEWVTNQLWGLLK